MSLSRIEIRNFQSLRKVDLDLGEFTVIVGASSSGKSALIRAFKAIASNVRGPAVITRGQKQAAITLRADGGYRTITLERSETSGLYRVADGQGSEQVFTKLNGGVPEAVTKLLRIAPVPASGASVNFASQFDRPYLLDDTGANVARVLGELTNVDTIFEAVRTANKRRLAASGLLKTRKADLDNTTARLRGFQDLPERLKALEEATGHHGRAQALTEQIRLLQSLDGQFAQRQAALRSAQTAAARTVPGTGELDAAYEAVTGLTALLRDTVEKQERLRSAKTHLDAQTARLSDAEASLGEVLASAPTCPTCGQYTV